MQLIVDHYLVGRRWNAGVVLRREVLVELAATESIFGVVDGAERDTERTDGIPNGEIGAEVRRRGFRFRRPYIFERSRVCLLLCIWDRRPMGQIRDAARERAKVGAEAQVVPVASLVCLEALKGRIRIGTHTQSDRVGQLIRELAQANIDQPAGKIAGQGRGM